MVRSFVRSQTIYTFSASLDQEMTKIQATVKQLQKNFSELQYDLQLKERQTPNIYDSIECEILWKRHRIDESQGSTIIDASEDDEDIHDYSTTGTPPPSIPSPTSYEHCLLSFLVGNETLTSTNNKDEKLIPSDVKKILPVKKPMNQPSTTILNNNNKKRRNLYELRKMLVSDRLVSMKSSKLNKRSS